MLVARDKGKGSFFKGRKNVLSATWLFKGELFWNVFCAQNRQSINEIMLPGVMLFTACVCTRKHFVFLENFSNLQTLVLSSLRSDCQAKIYNTGKEKWKSVGMLRISFYFVETKTRKGSSTHRWSWIPDNLHFKYGFSVSCFVSLRLHKSCPKI